MSESMAFIGGVAVAGLAALVLLKGTNIPLQSNFAMPQMPATVMAPQVMQPPMQYPYGGQPVYNNQPPAAPNPSQSVEAEKLNIQNERLKSENEQMKAQIQQLQNQVQNFTNWQWQQAQQNNQLKLAPAAYQPQTDAQWWRSPMLWAVGGATLTIGGGVVVAGVLALFSPKQRSTRTVQVIHPYHGSTPPLSPVRRAEFLPSRAEARRVEAPEYDEIH
ncbi:heterocyst differentiation related protein [Cylindrospermum sp. FACHB-282]|uniref:heterocyst differentiation related protein n=1 Tax=Cylindrospermum sp. FACHB-282 TaxID=2692794 RepID=UPI0016854FEA|nr:heterocyst differentiation related protein [Cylindrospermum sp. FACHB-282]MBD2388286.1 heterocyst differentiation related protein [Cylindrospermum sp. FACHB-282]